MSVAEHFVIMAAFALLRVFHENVGESMIIRAAVRLSVADHLVIMAAFSVHFFAALRF